MGCSRTSWQDKGVKDKDRLACATRAATQVRKIVIRANHRWMLPQSKETSRAHSVHTHSIMSHMYSVDLQTCQRTFLVTGSHLLRSHAGGFLGLMLGVSFESIKSFLHAHVPDFSSQRERGGGMCLLHDAIKVV